MYNIPKVYSQSVRPDKIIAMFKRGQCTRIHISMNYRYYNSD